MGSHRSVSEEYKEIRTLGRGAFGDALLARHVPTKTLYVLKRLPFHNPTTDEERNERVVAEREVAVLCMLHHPFITMYKESFIDSDTHFLNIVLEFCEGGDLRSAVLNAGKTPKKFIAEEKIWTWASQLLFALKYIHSKRVLHRDLKPANIFLTSKNQIKLGDFGIAKVASGTVYETASRGDGLAGTMPYIPPEACDGQLYSDKSDVWSLGVSLYELCALQLPFGGGNVLALVRNITTKAPKPLPSCYSVKLQRMIFEMLTKDPGQRPSAEQLIDQFLGPEVIRRMERTIQQHAELTAPGIPLRIPPDRGAFLGPRRSSFTEVRLSARGNGRRSSLGKQPSDPALSNQRKPSGANPLRNSDDSPQRMRRDFDVRSSLEADEGSDDRWGPKPRQSKFPAFPPLPGATSSPQRTRPFMPKEVDRGAGISGALDTFSLEPQFSEPPTLNGKRTSFLRKGSGVRTSLPTAGQESFREYQRRMDAVQPRVDLSAPPFTQQPESPEGEEDVLFVKKRKHILHSVLQTFVPQSRDGGGVSSTPGAPPSFWTSAPSAFAHSTDTQPLGSEEMDSGEEEEEEDAAEQGMVAEGTRMNRKRPVALQGRIPAVAPLEVSPLHSSLDRVEVLPLSPDTKGMESQEEDDDLDAGPPSNLVLPVHHAHDATLLREPTVLGSGRRSSPDPIDYRNPALGTPVGRSPILPSERPLSMMSVGSEVFEEFPSTMRTGPRGSLPLATLTVANLAPVGRAASPVPDDISIKSFSPPPTASNKSPPPLPEAMKAFGSTTDRAPGSNTGHNALGDVPPSRDRDSEIRNEDRVMVIEYPMSLDLTHTEPINAWGGGDELDLGPPTKGSGLPATPHKLTPDEMAARRNSAIAKSCTCCVM